MTKHFALSLFGATELMPVVILELQSKLGKFKTYRQVSYIRRTLVGNKIVDNSDVVGASNYIFIIDLTLGFSGLGTDNCKMRRESFKFWYMLCLILETLRKYFSIALWFDYTTTPRDSSLWSVVWSFKYVNSLAPQICGRNFTSVFFKLIQRIDVLTTLILD